MKQHGALVRLQPHPLWGALGAGWREEQELNHEQPYYIRFYSVGGKEPIHSFLTKFYEMSWRTEPKAHVYILQNPQLPPSGVGGTCDLLLTNRIWQKLQDVTPMITVISTLTRYICIYLAGMHRESSCWEVEGGRETPPCKGQKKTSLGRRCLRLEG